MRYGLFIKGVTYYTDFIYIPDVCVIYLYKHHDHRYSFSLFFYDHLFIRTEDHIRSKSQLFDVVQSLCDDLLNVDVQ